MVKLYDKGVYLINGAEIAETPEEVKGKTGQDLSADEASLNKEMEGIPFDRCK